VYVTPAERDDLIVRHLELVIRIARFYAATARAARVEFDDLVQEGNLAMVRAADRFNPARGCAFSTYIWMRVQKRIFKTVVRAHSDVTGLDLDLFPRKPRPPTATPLFPVVPFDPLAPCPHHGPIRRGSHLCCMVCHQSGKDHLAVLQRTAATDPKPERKPAPPDRPGKRETRRQRRLRLFGGLTKTGADAVS